MYCGVQFEMYRNTKSLCCVTGTNIVLKVNYTSKTQKHTHREELRLVVTRAGGGWGWEVVDKGSQKVQTSSYKINESRG